MHWGAYSGVLAAAAAPHLHFSQRRAQAGAHAGQVQLRAVERRADETARAAPDGRGIRA